MAEPKNNHQQRTELHRAIWSIANDLRGAVDGWDFKQYVLGMLFYRYISENLSQFINANQHKAGETNFDYASLTDEVAENARKSLVETKGFFILPSELFQNVRKNAPQDPDLNMTLARVFSNIEKSSQGAESEKDFKGLFDDIDLNSNKLGNTVMERNKRLSSLINGIGDMNLGTYKDNQIDAFGDAYEYLMTMYASNAGKSGGEFFTPQYVSELLTRLTLVGKTEVNKVYDPACGSGSLLLNFAKILGKEHVRQGFFGQEINLTTYNLCRINMFLHDIDYDKFDIQHGDTLLNPLHADLELFEAVVSNPPYSIKWPGDGNPLLINDSRFSPAGVLAPKSAADLAFIMHSLSMLATSGTAAIVCFPGIMYRGGAERKIRQYLVDNNYVDCIIQLPQNLFFGTGIATCILVLKKSKRDNHTLFIDASRMFVKVGNINNLTSEHIQRVVGLFTDRANVAYEARLVPNSEVAEQDYNLSVSTYVEKEDTREVVDIAVLNAEIRQVSARVNELRTQIDAIIAEIDPSNAGQELEAEQAARVRQYEHYRESLFLFTRENTSQILIRHDLSHIPSFGIEEAEVCSLSEVCTISNGRDHKPLNDGNIPVYGSGGIMRYVDQPIYSDESVLIPRKGSIGNIYYVNEPFWVVDTIFYTKIDKERINPKFLYHFLVTQHLEDLNMAGGVPSLTKSMLDKVMIPIPPMSDQNAIVSILDRFDTLVNDLKSGLPAEIALRRKQYEYYRDKLLTFQPLK